MLGSASTVLPSGHGGCPATHDAINLRGLKAPQWAARRIVRKTLAGKAGIECTDDVVLVADELVGNAIEHAGAAVNLSLDVYDWGVVVQVGDSGEDLAAVPGKPLVAQEDDEGGRGLFLVDVLASAWGVQRDKKGKRVIAIFLCQAGDAD
ncbi:ATP-binding protein [Streptomyces sp. NPDC058659]|uniref:ATP-binding protein n=1 Tax=Streptomyces sp. NPDC058659 TaxID=3346581 RepID=UPI003646C849